MLKPEDFLADLKRSLPGASIFHAWGIQPKDPPFPSPERSVYTPVEWLEYFVDGGRLCSDGNHESCDCAQHFLDMMGYASVECELIEKETRGQNQNKNWHSMRVGL